MPRREVIVVRAQKRPPVHAEALASISGTIPNGAFFGKRLRVYADPIVPAVAWTCGVGVVYEVDRERLRENGFSAEERLATCVCEHQIVFQRR